MSRQFFIKVLTAARSEVAPLDKNQKHMKLTEEVGELAKAMLAQDGKVRIKPDMEHPVYEVADCYLMLMDILSSIYPDHSPDEIYGILQCALDEKFKKWERYMEEDKLKEAELGWKIHNV
jgi:NTP pyrophosphatase (non-canonical NTP hydrolase)